jgi:CBS domain-containing protein
MITVDEIMTSDVAALREDATLGDVMRMMEEKHIRHVPVVNDKIELTGVVSHRDVLTATGSALWAGEGHSPESVKVGDIMTREVVTIDVHDSARAAATCLERHRFGCVPVVSGKTLKGIVTDTDLVAVAINLMEQLEQLEQQDAVAEDDIDDDDLF